MISLFSINKIKNSGKVAYSISLLVVYFSIFEICAQTYEITGKIVDSTTMEPLEAATVYAEALDKTLLSYTITGIDGSFLLDLKPSNENIVLFISYIGFKKFTKKIELNEFDIDLGNVGMTPEVEQLKGIDLIAERIPIIIKKDTLEFNADSFKTRPDANLEDLLKQLPGIEVGQDGSISNNGRPISQILINGTRFFGKDLKIATKNIPKEIIDKVQITSTKTEKERFTGKAAKSDEKTINVTIKRDKNKGLISRFAVGYGTDDRYQLNGIANYFLDKERFSFLAGANNINNSGFSFDEVYDMVGNKNNNNQSRGSGGVFELDNISFGFNDGITESSNIGASYANQLLNKSDISTDYFYGFSESLRQNTVFRENFIPDNRFFSNNSSNLQSTSNSHRWNTLYNFNLDSKTRVSFQPIFNTNNIESIARIEESTFSATEDLSNNSIIFKNSEKSQKNYGNTLELTRKYGAKGGFISVKLESSIKDIKGTENYISEFNSFLSPEPSRINQLADDETVEKVFDLAFSYRMPITNKKFFVDYDLQYISSDNKNERIINSFNEEQNDYIDFNPDLSSDFDYKTKELKPQIGLSYEGDKLMFNFNSSYKRIKLNTSDEIQNIRRDDGFNFIFYGARMRYKFNKSSRIFIDYNVSNGLPLTFQRQSISDVSNPQAIYTGNPDIIPETKHTTRLNYSSYNAKSKTSVFTFLQSNIFNEKIVNSVQVNENFVRNTTPINFNGNYNTFGAFGINKQVVSDSIIRVKLSTGSGFVLRRDASVNNNSSFISKTFRIVPRLGLQVNYRDLLDFEPSYSMTINKTSYNLENLNNVDFTRHSLKVRGTLYWPNKVIFGNDFNYIYNNNVQTGFDKSSIFWNMSLRFGLFKEKGSFKITAYDLLKQNNNVQRTSSEIYVEDRQSLILQRYLMFSFTYKINSLKK
ncbi:outer membrane beta-barrel protein [Flagellimonas onchidii]|uniref:outer membrane beta-barrel protein n=1 Tax=Flagellimonas onchidii TaxID=2562684 RepID=UPI0010A65AAC|nr:outer membrane beta-barrel protein [Allomuricauda onchidii]